MSMGLDIRLPIGMLFTSFGILLTAYGALSDPSIYVRSLHINVNLEWGLVLLAFGAVMWFFGHHATHRREPESQTRRSEPNPRASH
jgi:hypothetical protein